MKKCKKNALAGGTRETFADAVRRRCATGEAAGASRYGSPVSERGRGG